MQPLQRRQLRFRREQRSEGREVERDARVPVRPAPGDGLADEPFVEAVRGCPQTRHRRERQCGAARTDREVEEPGRRSIRCAPDDEERMLVLQPEERVERHDEAPLRLVAPPQVREVLELTPELDVDLARPQRFHAKTGALEPVHRLPDLPDRAAFERERRGLDHGLVAVVERMQSVRGVHPERPFRRAEDRDAPPARVGEPHEASDQPRKAVRRPDRIAGDDRHTADHLVGEECALVIGEEVRLVPPEDERREGVDSPHRHEIAREPALPQLLRVPVPPRCDPVVEQDARRGDHEQQHRDREPLAERAGEVRRAAHAQAGGGAPRLAEREGKRVILIGHDARMMDLLQRFRPSTYWPVLARRIEKMAAKAGK